MTVLPEIGGAGDPPHSPLAPRLATTFDFFDILITLRIPTTQLHFLPFVVNCIASRGRRTFLDTKHTSSKHLQRKLYEYDCTIIIRQGKQPL